ncbi:J domain-containing protein [Natronoglomus mannanivorans]|uniref:J domain-containing protein n=1 Tax=Natronoglomus mannanivorans TaxID=2979990 RepID=UPI0030838F7B
MGVYRSPLVLGLAAVFAGLAALLVLGTVVSGQLIALFVAVPLGLTSYFMYYHGSGQLARAVHQQHRTGRRRPTGGFGAGPRSRGGPRTRAEREARARASGRAASQRGGRSRRHDRTRDPRDRSPRTSSGPTRAEARDVLGVGPDADESEIKRAYRETVKEVHPDRGGDEATFKRVTAAYDRLSE